MLPLPFSIEKETLRLSVRITPKASMNAILGQQEIGEGKTALKVSVTAPPEKGKANAALIKLLSKSLKCPKSSCDIVAGETDRNKVVSITGDVAHLAEKLKDLCR